MKRNGPKISALAAILLAKATKDEGLTVAELVEITEIPRATIHRILSEPGFNKCVESQYPPRYYFDAVFQTIVDEQTKGAVGKTEREFENKVIEVEVDKAMPSLIQTDERLKSHIDIALQEITNTINNVRLFRKGEAKLDTDNLKKLRESIDTAQFVLETYYQFIDKYNVDFDDPTWWESF